MLRLLTPSLALCVLVPAIMLLGLTGFDGLYVRDSYAYFEYAVGPMTASLRNPGPWPDFFWPPGYPLLVALTSFVVGAQPAAGQLVSLLAGATVPVATAFLAREVWSDTRGSWRVPLVAGLLVAFSGQLRQASMVVMSDATGLAAATLGMWAIARFGRLRREGSPTATRWLVCAGAALAFAVLTRWSYALVAVPCTIYAVVTLVRHPGRTLGPALGTVAIALVILAPLIGPAIDVLGGNHTVADAPAFAGNLVQRSWNPLNAVQREFSTADGAFRHQLPMGLWYALAPAHWTFFTPVLAMLLVPGLWSALRRPSRELLWLVLGWAGVVYVFLAGDQYQSLRLALTFLPPLAILAAIGGTTVYDRLSPRYGRWVVAVGVVGLAVMTYRGWAGTNAVIVQKESLVTMARSVAAAVPDNARIVVFGPTPIVRQESSAEVHEMFWLEPEEIERFTAEPRPVFVLLDVDNVTTQWKDRTPELNYRLFRDGSGLVVVDRYGPFTLFRVAGNGG